MGVKSRGVVPGEVIDNDDKWQHVGRCSNYSGKCTYHVDNDEFHTFNYFHVFDTKKEKISNKKFFILVSFFLLSVQNLLFFKLASTISCIFVLFSIILAISLSLYFL